MIGQGVISSRTPEGRSGRCPVCRTRVRIEPSFPAGDAPCPVCGHLLFFLDVARPLRRATARAARSIAPSRVRSVLRRMAHRVRQVVRGVLAPQAGRPEAKREGSPSSGVWDSWLDG